MIYQYAASFEQRTLSMVKIDEGHSVVYQCANLVDQRLQQVALGLSDLQGCAGADGKTVLFRLGCRLGKAAGCGSGLDLLTSAFDLVCSKVDIHVHKLTKVFKSFLCLC